MFGILVIALAVFTVLREYFHLRPSSDASSQPGNISQKYANALGIAMQFFDVQKCMFEPFFHCKTLQIQDINESSSRSD